MNPDDRSYRAALYDRYVSSGQAVPVSGRRRNPRERYFENLISDHIPARHELRIFDLGSGAGEFLFFCRRAGFVNIRGIERSAEQIEVAEALGIGDVIAQGDLFGGLEQLSDGSIDVIMAFDVLEHLTKAEVAQVFRECRRVLASTGRLIVHVPNGASPFVGAVRYGDFTHELAFTRDSLRQLALAAGFGRIRCYEDKLFPSGIKRPMRAVAWSLCRFFMNLVTAAETGAWESKAIWTRNVLAVIDQCGNLTQSADAAN